MQIKRVFDTGFEAFELIDADGKVTSRVNSSSSSTNIEEALTADNLTPDMQKKLNQWLKKSLPKESKPKPTDQRVSSEEHGRRTGNGFDLKTRDNKARRTSQRP